jgi:hypothetical protein
MTTELFARADRSARAPVTVRAVQSALRRDEVLFEIALGDPASYAILVTRSMARIQRLPARSAILAQADALVSGTRTGRNVTSEAKVLGATLLTGVKELAAHRRVIISAEGSLQQVPFELLEHPSADSERLLATHVVSYTPSASILVLLRTRTAPAQSGRFALAVAASPSANAGPNSASGSSASAGTATNGIRCRALAQVRSARCLRLACRQRDPRGPISCRGRISAEIVCRGPGALIE